MQKLGLLNSKKYFLSTSKDSSSNSFSFMQNGKNYTFKFSKNLEHSYISNLNEVFLCDLAKKIGIACQPVDFACFFRTTGLILENYVKQNQKEITFYDIINEKYLKELYSIVGEDFFDKKIFPMLKAKQKKKNSIPLLEVTSNDVFSQLNYLVDCHMRVRKTSKEILEHIDNNYVQILNLFIKLEKPIEDSQIFNEVLDFAEKHNLVVDKSFKQNLCQIILLDTITNQDGRSINKLKFIIDGKNLSMAPLSENGNCIVGQSFRIIKCKKQIKKTDFFYEELAQNPELKKNLQSLRKIIENKKDMLSYFKKTHKEGLAKNIPKNVESKYNFCNTHFELWFNIMEYNLNELYKNLKMHKNFVATKEREAEWMNKN